MIPLRSKGAGVNIGERSLFLGFVGGWCTALSGPSLIATPRSSSRPAGPHRYVRRDNIPTRFSIPLPFARRDNNNDGGTRCRKYAADKRSARANLGDFLITHRYSSPPPSLRRLRVRSGGTRRFVTLPVSGVRPALRLDLFTARPSLCVLWPPAKRSLPIKCDRRRVHAQLPCDRLYNIN